ncbi:MAG: GWxTD domain-containing protein [Ignavibacteriales bacterium]|nr:GWxTD domain-containing protein [Ignavibacteriales bacterium]
MKTFVIILTALFLTSHLSSTAQTDTTKTEPYLKALEALQKKDTISAITLLKESVKQENDAQSYFELAKLISRKKTDANLNEAAEYLDRAIMLDPNNVEYPLLLASVREELFYVSRLNQIDRERAFNQYKKILELDPKNAEALYNLGRLNVEEFLKYHRGEVKTVKNRALNPVQRATMFRGRSSLLYETQNEFDNTRGNFVVLEYEGYAKEGFDAAEKYLFEAIKQDPNLEKSYCELSKLHIYNNTPEKAIPIWNSIQNKNLSKDAHLYLAMLYYMTKQFDKSSEEFENAISLMGFEEKENFTFNSAKLILKPKFDDELNTLSRSQLEKYIEKYWDKSNPLNLSKENVRLLEHYYRVAYANIFFSNVHYKIVGWKTDRGEVLIRYGQPLDKYRYLFQLVEEFYGQPPTEVWDYGNKVLAFIDPTRINNYMFAQPWTAIVPMNTHDEVISLRQTKPDEYIPKFEGPVFDLSYKAYQFASTNKTQTDVFVAYGVNFLDSTTSKEKFADGYDVGLFMFDNNFNKKFDYRKTCTSLNQSQEYLVNTLEMTLYPQTGNLALEMIRKKDKGVTSYHGKYNVRNFSSNELALGDVVLATNVETSREIIGSIKRKEISVLPNPAKTFGKEDKLYLYYEIYNLKPSTNNLTDFEQKITIQKKEEGGVLNSILSVVGLDKEGKKVALTSKYQTQEKDPQMYLQLDMSKYEPGEYLITVSIKENATGKEVSSQTEINWQ